MSDGYGEVSASAEVSQATTGAISTATLTVAPLANTPDGAPVLLYKVYSGPTDGSQTLLGVIDARGIPPEFRPQRSSVEVVGKEVEG